MPRFFYFIILSHVCFITYADISSDWVSEPAAKSLCQGHYDTPFTLSSPLSFEKSDMPIEISSNETTLAFEGQSRLSGEVRLRQGDRLLEADEALLERSDHTSGWERFIAKGHIHYLSPAIAIWGQQAEYYPAQRYFLFQDVSYRLYSRHARGKAKKLEIEKDKKMILWQANYTTCAPTQNTWLLSTDKLTLYKRGRGVAHHIRLDMQGVPIFYFPYFNYPIDNKRHSGFLFPTYGSTSNSGYELSIPYYVNLAPNYDLLLTGNWLSERGLQGQSQFRYLFKESAGRLNWNFLPHDKKYAAFSEQNRLSPPSGLVFSDPRITALNTPTYRSAIHYHHSTQWGRRWQANVIFNHVSDDNYLVDLGNDIQTASTVQLPQKANVTYFGEYWSHTLNIEEYQVLQPLSKPINEAVYKRQPQWVFQAFYPTAWHPLTFGLNGELVNFNHRPDILTGVPTTTGHRYHFCPILSIPWQSSWFFLTPRFQLDSLLYDLRLGTEALSQQLPSQLSRTIPLYDVDGGLIFERPLTLRQSSFTQTLEPRLYYLYVPYRDQSLYPNFDSGNINFSYSQLFRHNRFSGRDRVGDTEQITLSLTSRLFPSQGGKELLRASVGQIFYFRERKVMLCEVLGQEEVCALFETNSAIAPHSNLIGEAEWHFNTTWSGGAFGEWKPLHDTIEQAGFNLQYHPDKQKIININYYWLKHDLAQTQPNGSTGSLNQGEFSLFWPMNLYWQWLSRWQYDFKQRQTVELLAGLEYNGCCFAVQVVGSRYRQSANYSIPLYATGIFAQFVFKGLSAIGLNNPDNKLQKKIPGYIPLSRRQNWIPPSKEPLFPPNDIPMH